MKQIEITYQTLRAMRQPEAERILLDKLPLIIAGEGSMPFSFTGQKGLGKTRFGLEFVSSILASHGWKVEYLPENLTGKAFLELLASWIMNPVRRVIIADETHESLSETFWREFKLLISDDCRKVSFQAEFGDAETRAMQEFVFNPADFLFLFASNFDLEKKGSQEGAVRSRTVQIPFLPYNDSDKAAVWKAKADAMGFEYSAESAEIAIRNCLANGRAIGAQITALRELALGSGKGIIDLRTKEGMQAALLRCQYRPRGFTDSHISILRYISAPGGRQVKEIKGCASHGASPLELLEDSIAAGLVHTGSNSRKCLTAAGVSYLARVAEFDALQADALRIARLPAPEWQKALAPEPPAKVEPVAPIKADKPVIKKGKGGKSK